MWAHLAGRGESYLDNQLKHSLHAITGGEVKNDTFSLARIRKEQFNEGTLCLIPAF